MWLILTGKLLSRSARLVFFVAPHGKLLSRSATLVVSLASIHLGAACDATQLEHVLEAQREY